MLNRGASGIKGDKPARKVRPRRLPVASVVVADGDTLFRVGLISAISESFPAAAIREVGTAATLDSALRDGPPDLVLFDPCLPGLTGYLWLAQRRKQYRRATWIAISGVDTAPVRHRALVLGVDRFISKRASRETVQATMLAALAGLRRQAKVPPREMLLLQGLSRLTRAELRVLSALPDNPSHRHIMRTLGIALPTVKTHMSRILAKLGLRNRTEAAVVASRLSHIESPSLCIDRPLSTPSND